MKKATKDDYINQISDIFYEAVEKDLAPFINLGKQRILNTILTIL